MLDLGLYVVQAIIALWMAWMGLKLTLETPTSPQQKWRYKKLFLVLGGLSLGIIVAQGILKIHADAAAARFAESLATGGDNFAYIDVMIPGNSVSPILFLHHPGRFPLYEVTLRVYDQNWPEGSQHPVFRTLKEFPVLAAPSNRLLNGNAWNEASGGPNLSGVDAARFTVVFSARNGSWTQKVSLRRVEAQWVVAMRVFRERSQQQTVLLERTDPGFPRDVEGKIEW